jgi:hypothetical protein
MAEFFANRMQDLCRDIEAAGQDGRCEQEFAYHLVGGILNAMAQSAIDLREAVDFAIERDAEAKRLEARCNHAENRLIELLDTLTPKTGLAVIH